MVATNAGGVVLSAMGAFTPVGAGVVQSCASIRAAIARFVDHPDYIPVLPQPPIVIPEPITCAPALGLDEMLPLEERLVRLATRAARDMLPVPGLTRRDLAEAALVLALPPADRQGVAPLDAGRLLVQLQKRTSLPQPLHLEVLPSGHVAAIQAVHQAVSLLHTSGVQRCLVLAVDSYLTEEVLAWLDLGYRVRSQRNVDGFIPGEAALLLLVEARDSALARGVVPLAALEAMAFTVEPSPIPGETISTASGMCEAVRETAGLVPGFRADWVISDLNGESYRSHEWGVTRVRLKDVFENPLLWHPAECTGDVGAASGALQLAVAARAFARGYAPGDRALLLSGSDDGSRGACIVHRPNS